MDTTTGEEDMSIEIQINEDGVWVVAKSKGLSGMLNLNNIVNDLTPTLVRRAFIGAINEAVPPETEEK